jgi:hypothetical protein
MFFMLTETQGDSIWVRDTCEWHRRDVGAEWVGERFGATRIPLLKPLHRS